MSAIFHYLLDQNLFYFYFLVRFEEILTNIFELTPQLMANTSSKIKLFLWQVLNFCAIFLGHFINLSVLLYASLF